MSDSDMRVNEADHALTVRVDGNDRVVAPRSSVKGTLQVPGDKSVSHRLAMLAGMAEGTATFEGFLTSEDCLHTLMAVEALGATVNRQGGQVTVTGTGGRFLEAGKVLDMGNSGTGIRLLAGLLAGHPFTTEMTGDASLRSRPMKRIQGPLEQMGARLELTGPRGCAPIRVHGARLKPIEYVLPMASAQVKSCVLLAGLLAEGRTQVIEPNTTRDHTERLLRAMGVDCQTDGLSITLQGLGGKLPRPRTNVWSVPGDFSAAAFWLGAAAMLPGSQVLLTNVGLNPRRTAFLNVLRRMGAKIEIFPTDGANAWEPAGAVSVEGGDLHGTEVSGEEIPNLIDELPMVAVLGAMASGRTEIRDAEELRVKETDRITAMLKSLAAFGVRGEEKPDGMLVFGGGQIRGGGAIESFGDHRIAMSGAVLALAAAAPTRICDVGCVATSYPAFWNDLERLTVGIRGSGRP
ncbi:MAG: 3-phosphoshikimate 1-carboxyvinyltransferase [Verrucomicrobia bacterium]|nr:3-phosphoshikimate 1-carboxyvinyltransferase [Verrucomicrobiota bacterium]